MRIFFEILVRIASYGPQIDQSHGENRLNHIINICYSPAGRSVLGETIPEVLGTALGGTQTEGTVSPNTERPRPVNNMFIFFLLRFKSFRKILLQPPTYVC